MTPNKCLILISILLMTSGFLQCTSLHAENKLSRRRTRTRAISIPNPKLFFPSRAIGIHLGTTYSSIAVYKYPAAFEMGYCHPLEPGCAASSFYDTMVAVVNEHGNAAMPSCVSFTDTGVLIGEPAKAHEALNSERTICGTIRLIGKRFDDPEVESYIKTLPYKVVNKENKPHIQVQFKNGEVNLYSPEEICAMILGKLKEIAEAYMGTKSGTAVVLISESHVDNKVRGQVMEACDIAGIKKIRTYVGTPTLVAGLYDALYWGRENFKVLIFDLGGSACSAIVVHRVGIAAFGATAAKEDAHLGGQTFDMRLVDYFVNLIKSKYKKDISNNLVALTRLRNECEKAKISLSSSDRVMIKAQFALVDDEVLMFEEILTREMFEELNMDLFNKTIDLVKAALDEGSLNKTEIDEILLIGGSSEIPMIQHLVKNYFGKEPLNVVKPKEAFAFAATLLAGSLPVTESDPVVLNSMTVGIETIGGIMERFIDIETRLPLARSKNYTTYYDGQTTMEIKVFEGQRQLTKYGHYLGSLQISNLPRRVTTVEVTVDVYKDKSIRVTAEHKATQNKKWIIIPNEERYNDRERISGDYAEFNKNYKEDGRVWENIKFAMRLSQLQPRSMGFGVVNVWDRHVFQPQGFLICPPR